MVTRTMLLLDRFATLVVGVALVLGGLVATWWWSGQPVLGVPEVDDSVRGLLPDAVDTAPLRDVVAAGWYPYAAAAVGVLLVVVGLVWMARHLRRTAVRRLTLGGSDASGRLEVAAGTAARAAARALSSSTVGVRSADGVVVRDRGQLVARLAVVLDPTADLATVARRCDEVSGQLSQMLEREDLRCRVELRVGR